MGKLSSEIRSDMPEPIIAHELEAHNSQDPKHLLGWYLWVWPSAWVEELRDVIEASGDLLLFCWRYSFTNPSVPIDILQVVIP